MILKHFNIKGFNLTFVFKNRWTDKKRFSTEFRRWELGIWLRKTKIVGCINFSEPKKWKYNHVNSYMLGVNLLVILFWLDWNFNGKHIKIEDYNGKQRNNNK